MNQLVRHEELKLRWNKREKAVSAVTEYIRLLHDKGFLTKENDMYIPARQVSPGLRLEELLKRDARYFSE